MEAATISSKFQIVIPAAIRKKYAVKPGYKAVFIPLEKSLRVIFVPPIQEARGLFPGLDTDPQRDEEDELT
ncbi:MAG: AbrB/MazE/SpoVT family DNA-binding domain-containing protein [Caldilinea sp.]|nr:AbrB/MazE/SpoVT family DNA-binding domain-containing protein [Caldilinea sp.]MDW8441653.1 AbrB/MazE/SpoVT family DNA-binding domain-containing protein [Caldilineaceae bacterium]